MNNWNLFKPCLVIQLDAKEVTVKHVDDGVAVLEEEDVVLEEEDLVQKLQDEDEEEENEEHDGTVGS